MNDKYNKYIDNYLENDTTKSAIMITAPWGYGKSYYINNTLTSYLKDKKQKKIIIVSLYGKKEIRDISKAIYLEVKLSKIKERHKNKKVKSNKIKKKNKIKEVKQGTLIITKTIFNNLMNRAGFNLDVSEEELNKVYNSIDLSDKLIVLEDLERANISIKEILGYVNNLVEQDNVKVLIVANETEIIKYCSSDDTQNKDSIKYTYETLEYFKIKEKTISDTINYKCDIKETLDSILREYNFSEININIQEEFTERISKKIKQLIDELNICNFRSIIYACQKTNDFFRNIKQVDFDFFENTFLGIVAYSLKKKNDNSLHWKDDLSSINLGTYQYPLYKICYDFIEFQEKKSDDIQKYQNEFIEKRKFEQEQKKLKTDLNDLYNYYLLNQEELEKVIKNIHTQLKDDMKIPYDEYANLFIHLIYVKDYISCPNIIDDCRTIMIKNLKCSNQTKEKSKLLHKINFRYISSSNSKELNDEFTNFIKDIEDILKDNYIIDFDYKVTSIKQFHIDINEQRDRILENKEFFKNYDVDKFYNLLKKCYSKDINELREIFMETYSSINIGEFLLSDLENLIKLKDKVNTILINKEYMDNIVKLQLEWFESDLEKIISKLKKYQN